MTEFMSGSDRDCPETSSRAVRSARTARLRRAFGSLPFIAGLVLGSPPLSAATAAPQREGVASGPVAITTGPREDPNRAGGVRSTADIVAEAEPAVALIRGSGSTGTGTLVGLGLLVTNSHVLKGEFIDDLTITFPSADGERRGPCAVALLAEDTQRDLSLLAVETDLRPLRLAETYKFRKGEDITIIGNPTIGEDRILENAISRGVMSTRLSLDGQDFYQLNVAINPGNSGGPVLDSTGAVIGVATLKSTKQEALAFCVPIEDLRQAIRQLTERTDEDFATARSKHRLATAVETMGVGGALFCLGIEGRRAGTTEKVSGQERESIDELLESIERRAARADDSLNRELPVVKTDTAVDTGLRIRLDQLSESFQALREAYGQVKSRYDANELRLTKANHKRLFTALAKDVGVSIAPRLLAVFEDRDPQIQLPRAAVIDYQMPGWPFRDPRLPGGMPGFGLPGRIPGFGTIPTIPRGPSWPAIGPRRPFGR